MLNINTYFVIVMTAVNRKIQIYEIKKNNHHQLDNKK